MRTKALMIAAALAALAWPPLPAAAEGPVLRSGSMICHCPGGKHYEDVSRRSGFPDIESCLETGAREPKAGQGSCPRRGAGRGAYAAPAAPVAPSPPRYDRALYGDGWSDDDGDCRNTRAEILEEMSTAVVRRRAGGCSVESGRWIDPYTGNVLTDAADVDIDHVVPLAWAHAHGAASWPAGRKLAFANWAPNLQPVTASVNREKGADGPLRWLPPNVGYRCEYLLRFERVVLTWDLRLSPAERAGMNELRASYCPAR